MTFSDTVAAGATDGPDHAAQPASLIAADAAANPSDERPTAVDRP